MTHLEFFLLKLGNLSFLYRYEIPFFLCPQPSHMVQCASELSLFTFWHWYDTVGSFHIYSKCLH